MTKQRQRQWTKTTIMDARQYTINAGWDWDAVAATARLGVSEIDEETIRRMIGDRCISILSPQYDPRWVDEQIYVAIEVAGDDDEAAEEELRVLRRMLPAGVTAEWTGNGNGDTMDIAIDLSDAVEEDSAALLNYCRERTTAGAAD